MPFYEYQCQACGAQVEVMQKISDAPLKKCPECGKSRLAKLVSAPVFRLKGAGWYETDFKTDKDKKRNLVETEKAESSSADKADSKGEAKAESKGESKTESKAESRDSPRTEGSRASKAAAKPTARPAARRAARPAKKKARR